MPDETRVPITSAVDIVTARQEGRSLASRLGFDPGEATLIAAAITEVSRNIVQHAGSGEIHLRTVNSGRRKGICVVALDQGPGIADIP
jgi:serine/threonine-protein kinase RsbT